MPDKIHLKVYLDKSKLVYPDGTEELFIEGANSDAARERYRQIRAAFESGFLKNTIENIQSNRTLTDITAMSEEHIELLDTLIDSVTSEVGRALVGLTILQLCIKTIAPTQSIRLHKGGNSSRDFSWKEGVSMRSLDNTFITPVLREYGLLRLNADGFMMTRSLAENYPYSIVYKANLRGARKEWTQIVEAIETGSLMSNVALQYTISLLLNKADKFKELADSTLLLLESKILNFDTNGVKNIINKHIDKSDYAARIMEIAMHSLFQVLVEDTSIELNLKPLSQMRSANKKHGNIGDIELLDHDEIIESWDAKYGISYLRDELEELADKIIKHKSVNIVGFITSREPERLSELQPRMNDLEDIHGLKIHIVTINDWVDNQINRICESSSQSKDTIARMWLKFYCESLAQKRTEIAPIDEPCYNWLKELSVILSGY